ncbi:MAG TPA: winged helix-turn-helix domain-containing protein, partial [Gemmatimonadaceae bacterium]|nr:winged helix-turn-helix domain-containing protein [Gemmatimonadaceae bacterium]
MSNDHDERDDKEDPTKGPNRAGPLHALALLAEPVRRAIYEWVAAAEGPVTRDDVARAVGIGRPLAAFHLDRLAAAGLLEITYERRTGWS